MNAAAIKPTPTPAPGFPPAGIYSGDEAFQPILGNAQLVGKLNAQPVAGCVPAAHKAAPLDPVSDCKATWVDGRAGTGGWRRAFALP